MAFNPNVRLVTAAAAAVLILGATSSGQEATPARPLQKNASGAPAKPATSPAAPTQPGTPKSEGTAGSESAMALSSIVIEAIDGRNVGHRKSATGPFTPAKVGDRLQEGAELMLGYAATVRIRVGASQLFTFDQAGKSVFRVARNDGKTDITRIDIDQGRVGFDVQSTRFANDVRIEAPEMTLAIKGTIGGVEVTRGHPTVAFGDVRNRGLIVVDWPGGRTVPMRGNERSDARTQDPARYQDSRASVSTAPLHGQEDEEALVEKRATGGAESASKDLGTTSIPNELLKTSLTLPGLGNQPIMDLLRPRALHSSGRPAGR